jgi:hypothetical protein
MMKKLLYVMALLTTMPLLQAVTISITEGSKSNSYGNFSGIAVEYDSLIADYTPNLVDGQDYYVNSLSVIKRGATDATDYYLGAYSGVTLTEDSSTGNYQWDLGNGSGALGGATFLGVSSNTVNLNSLSDGSLATWNFGTSVTITAGDQRAQFPQNESTGLGTGVDDVIFFVLQTGTAATTSLVNTGNTSNVDRIDGSFTLYEFDTEYNGVLDGNEGRLIANRPLEFESTLTVVPEPSSLALTALALLTALACRAKKNRK